MIRAFIAVELPEALRQEVAAFQSELKSSGADVKWVELENLHLTLKFLGNIEEAQVPVLKEALAAPARGFPSFTFHLEGIGAFPRTTSPRVVWVGVSEGKEKLVELAKTVERTCSGLGFPAEERPFSAHLTIGRVRSQERLAAAGGSRTRRFSALASLIKRLQVAESLGKTPASGEKIVLFQSVLSPKGPLYTPLAEIR
ncbi:MAG: RNA 2',3'-cyclic phosphodiesterase [Candidatus Omnitrophica bacterium]|nr:RNA 2',3'-cyclic phosphodiesterase [Candidatus Omnitrophota bacterium]